MSLIFRNLLLGWLPKLLLAACAILVPWYCYQKGLELGRLEIRAEVDKQMLETINGQLTRHRQLITDANQASERLLKISAQRMAEDQATTKTLREVLNETTALRTACVYDLVVMRELNTARQRAADAAAGGLDDAVPGADWRQR